MKNRYTLSVLCCIAYFTAFSQQTDYPMETVGTPSSSYMVNAYSGWTNNGVLTYSGNAEVQNVNPSNNLSASGGGNVYFTNTAGTYMEISGFSSTSVPQSLDITFGMFGYDANNLNELVLEYTTDGTNYTALPYKRLFRNYMPPTPWDVMVSDPLPGNISFGNLKIRFRQTTSTGTFRIDDIEANFYYTLPIKLISFSAYNAKAENNIQWKASSTDEHEYFVIERSKDGRYFSPLANVQVKGVGVYDYIYSDKSEGKTFYRLKLVDVSGRSTYSQIIYINEKSNSADVIQKIYPVPATHVLNTQLMSTKDEDATVTLTDMSGRTVIIKNFSLTKGMNNCAIGVEQLNAGMYILKLVTGNITETRSVMIK